VGFVKKRKALASSKMSTVAREHVQYRIESRKENGVGLLYYGLGGHSTDLRKGGKEKERIAWGKSKGNRGGGINKGDEWDSKIQGYTLGGGGVGSWVCSGSRKGKKKEQNQGAGCEVSENWKRGTTKKKPIVLNRVTCWQGGEDGKRVKGGKTGQEKKQEFTWHTTI